MAKCGKVEHRTWQAAITAMRKVPPAGPAGLVPTHVYRCGRCRAWHITGKVRRR